MGIFGKNKRDKEREAAKKEAEAKAAIRQEEAAAKRRDVQADNCEREAPVIRLEKVETRIDEGKPRVEYRVHRRATDVHTFSAVELKAMFVETVKALEDSDVLHLLWLAHDELHKEHRAPVKAPSLGELMGFAKSLGVDLEKIIEDNVPEGMKVAGVKVIDLRDLGGKK